MCETNAEDHAAIPRSACRCRAVEGAVVRLNQLVAWIAAIAQGEVMQRRQSARDIHHEHGAVAERTATRGRPVETAVQALNHTSVGLSTIETRKVMQGGECVREVEREDGAESVGATRRCGAVEEAIGALNQRAGWPGAVRPVEAIAYRERPGGRVKPEDRSRYAWRSGVDLVEGRRSRPPLCRIGCRRQSRRALRQGTRYRCRRTRGEPCPCHHSLRL